MIGIIIFVAIVVIFVCGINNEKTRKATLIIFGTIFLLIAILIGSLFYGIYQGCKWKEYNIDSGRQNAIARSVGKANIDVFISLYGHGYFNAYSNAYMTDWYDSVSALSDALEFETDEQKEAFNISNKATEQSDSIKKLLAIQGHHDTVLYEVNSFSGYHTEYYIVYCSEAEKYAFLFVEND